MPSTVFVTNTFPNDAIRRTDGVIIDLICCDGPILFCFPLPDDSAGGSPRSNAASRTSKPFDARSDALAMVSARAFGIPEDNIGLGALPGGRGAFARGNFAVGFGKLARGTLLGTAALGAGRGADILGIRGGGIMFAAVREATGRRPATTPRVVAVAVAVAVDNDADDLPADLPAEDAAVRAAPRAAAADSGEVSGSSSPSRTVILGTARK